MNAKKYLIILVLRILETCSDERHPLTQVKIAEMISDKYPCERKTVGRNIKFLREVGYPIVKTHSGFYMDKQSFSREEIDLVLALVRRAELPRCENGDCDGGAVKSKDSVLCCSLGGEMNARGPDGARGASLDGDGDTKIDRERLARKLRSVLTRYYKRK